MRQVLALNHSWKAQARPSPDFTTADFKDQDWPLVRLPHTNLDLPLANFDPASFCFATGYRRTVALDPAWATSRVFLCFEAVMARAEVWINGKLLLEHRGGYTPFEVEIPPEALRFPSLQIAVLADAREDPRIPPFGHAVDYLTYGGIYREVQLEIRPSRHLKTLTLETPEASVPLVRGTVYLDGPCLEAWEANLEVKNQAGAVLAQTVLTMEQGMSTVDYTLEVPGAEPWDLDRPILHQLSIKTPDDELSRTFGFRQAVFTAQGFFLNGRLVKLFGLNRHQAWPVRGYAMPKRAQAEDADLLKFTLGCNMVRSSHYPPSRHFLDRCDQIGLLVFEEIPGWQHIGNKEWQDTALQHVEEMIVRDRHRPSVVLFGVRINESADNDEFYAATNALAHRLDPSRQTGGVRNFAGSRLLEDVYTYNDFVHSGHNHALDKPQKIARKRVPYLVSEHNGHMFPTKKADPEARRVEHALRHARVHNAAAANPAIAGALGWVMADYATHGDFGSGDQICHHGVLDQFRCPKPAADFYASQRSSPPFGSVASRLAIGDHDAAVQKEVWVFTNAEEVRVYQGERLVQTFHPDTKTFPALAHPPVRVNDLIGNAVEQEPGLSRTDARRIKSFLRAYQQKGGMPSLRYLLPLFWVMMKKGWGTPVVYDLYTRHVAGWGAGARSWRFEGWTGGTKVWEQGLGPSHAASLGIHTSTPVVQEEETWDCVRVEVRLLDSRGNEVWYGAEPVTLQVRGPLRIIGPATRPLTGGSTAFWLESTGEAGIAEIQASTADFSSVSLTVEVKTALY